METFEKTVTWEEFKEMAAEFLRRCQQQPTPSDKQLSGGLHCLRIAYLSLDPKSMWAGSAAILLSMAEKKAFETCGELL